MILIVLGIDPGSRCVGYGLIESEKNIIKVIDHGYFRYSTRFSFPERLNQIYNDMENILDSYAPDVMAVEDIFVSKNVKSSLKLGHARGVIVLAGVKKGVPLAEYTPREVKQAIVGRGNASKFQIQAMIVQILNLHSTKLQEDEADGLAVAVCHGFKV